jgi:peptidoglycan/xylan/chitin deacetylase (PgdA/CDA1 family)
MTLPAVIPAAALLATLGAASATVSPQSDPTTITAWPDGRRGAASITFDDASINQFRVAAPLLNERGLPGTFFVITAQVAGPRHEARFVGRPTSRILSESAAIATNADNYLERISAAPFLGFDGLVGLRTSAARPDAQTFARVDDAYARARDGALPPLPEGARIYMDNAGEIIQAPPRADVQHVTWDELKTLASQGHEIGSHTVSHPRLDALDDTNIRDELVRSREEILSHLGPAHTFAVECPFGIDDERAVGHALEIYEASRNRMPEPWLEEHNRSSRRDPTASDKAYVQWQRGLLDDTTLDTARGWIDTTAGDDNIWLVLVIHGVEGIGWEAIPRATLAVFFDHLAAARDKVWVATFQDVTKYMRERQHARVQTRTVDAALHVSLAHALDPALYDLPLTLKTYVPAGWTRVGLTQGATTSVLTPRQDAGGSFVLYDARPNVEEVVLTENSGN